MDNHLSTPARLSRRTPFAGRAQHLGHRRAHRRDDGARDRRRRLVRFARARRRRLSHVRRTPARSSSRRSPTRWRAVARNNPALHLRRRQVRRSRRLFQRAGSRDHRSWRSAGRPPRRFCAPQPIAFAEAIPIAALGLVVNVASAWLLSRGGQHHHGDAHVHDETRLLDVAGRTLTAPHFRGRRSAALPPRRRAPKALLSKRSGADGARQQFTLVDRGGYLESLEDDSRAARLRGDRELRRRRGARRSSPSMTSSSAITTCAPRSCTSSPTPRSRCSSFSA